MFSLVCKTNKNQHGRRWKVSIKGTCRAERKEKSTKQPRLLWGAHMTATALELHHANCHVRRMIMMATKVSKTNLRHNGEDQRQKMIRGPNNKRK